MGLWKKVILFLDFDFALCFVITFSGALYESRMRYEEFNLAFYQVI